MARLAARQLRCLVAVVFVAGSMKMTPNFATLGGSLQHAVRSTRTAAHGAIRVQLPPMNPLPWAEDLEGRESLQRAQAMNSQEVDNIVQHIIQVDLGLHGSNEPTKQQLYEYDRTLSAHIQVLEEQIEEMQADFAQDTMEASSEKQLMWLESLLQTIGEMKEQLRRVRSAQDSVQTRLEKKNRGFFEQLMHAAACGFGGHKVVSNRDYPATGVSSFTGEPPAMF